MSVGRGDGRCRLSGFSSVRSIEGSDAFHYKNASLTKRTVFPSQPNRV